MATQIRDSGAARRATNRPVFFGAIAVIGFFVAFALINADQAEALFGSIQLGVTQSFGWLFVLTANILLIICGVIALSRLGSIRLGGQDAKPEFGTLAWFSMLFSAGMGIGLVFYGVAEPITHFAHPPLTHFSVPGGDALGDTANNAQHAMGLTFLHWGLHAWAIYVVIGLGLAYISFNRKLPLSIGSFLKAFWNGVPVWLVTLVDVIAVVATVCGVAASLGFGASQINSGLTRLVDVPDTNLVKLFLIVGITALATLSVGLGLDRGIKRLSEFNITLAGGLALFVLVVGPTVFILDGFIQNIGYYLQRFVYLSTWTETYTNTEWQSDWTIFYYAWWISWSPFVGIFIARISFGRTVRQFIAGTLLVPTLVTFAWMTIFGNAALYIELFGNGGLAAAVDANMASALFEFLSNFPLGAVFSVVAIIVIATFFVTSADSGALVTAMIASGGDQEAPLVPRITWAVAIGILAAALLYAGGLTALQTAAIVTGLPFALILLVMGYAIIQMLHTDYENNLKTAEA